MDSPPSSRWRRVRRVAVGLLVVPCVLLALAAGWLWRPAAAPAVPCGTVPVASERLRAHVRALSETFHPRDHLHPENLERAAAHLEAALEQAGGRMRSEPYTVEGRPYRNVIASFGPEAGERLVVGAHYDAAQGAPGADDNASGVAVLLELATWLGAHPPPLRVDLVAFTLEEPPWFRTQWMGSAVHARALRESGAQLRAMLSLESLGYFSEAPGSQRYPLSALSMRYPTAGNFVAVVGPFREDGLIRSVAGALRAGSQVPVEFIAAPRSLRGVDFSDHLNFWKEGYPAVMLTDTAFFRNTRYHTAQDTWDTLNYDRLAEVVKGTRCVVHVLTTQDE